MTVRTRFAPSPTGYLHIGGVRTALFNWLYARRHEGQFVLRIDDTDAARNRAEAVKPILDGFDWLGMDWDEGPTKDASGDSFGPHKPYFQGQRNDKYVAAAMKLMAEGKAYPDYTTQAEQDSRRDLATRLKKAYVHRGSNRDVAPEENLRLYKEKPAPVLLKVPAGETVVFEDHVRGRVEVSTDTIRDPALLRAPNEAGVCGALYAFATVVDEVDFGITHVIRAEEHLSNTPVQLLIYSALLYQAMGKKPPEFAHIPLVYYKGEKMSKRKLPPLSATEINALKACGWTEDEIKGRDDLNIATVAYYRELGYLPGALVNYLLRLGWSLNDTDEFIPLDVAVKNFSLDRVTKAPGNFDEKKLLWLQGEYMKLLSPAEKLERSLPYLRRAKLVSDPIPEATHALLLKIAEASAERIKLLSDFVFYSAPLLKDVPDYNPKAVADKLAKPGVADRLRGFADELRALEPFDAPTILAAFMGYATKVGVKPRDLDGPLRVAVTGETTGFGLPETLVLLGRDKVLARIENAIKMT
ncbi:glutamyl-trna synthetase : Glutamate--tRNA ligase OS=Pirellula staleyi (strain ATCC 27377 / DSM 6068 / ICPB 4128) GN=gltX PE=3 SV=1: tRNA-synt_1c: tRNA-synt_1c [Gemmata massiliana]|uniref:Glutamate--tRNA ligase n=1 Tax=Gemmata massiliana TaxID=1210884 RepID=A0A6P2CUD7_9BACT|nr:glutamate--tRNA ligase family protein [Gemmata massiliana]VTR91314.1 glutamyl-trna synthetase : Glutamate--tRNA ligase OS=Pirellula staleyi (strain ATCC 27377 / DSM 6068 / ICPB 4128) GN=gltX PE=3 SV=1: tRNA-synt_1c: tRNA-synt_1c [Gemmata massiliana]